MMIQALQMLDSEHNIVGPSRFGFIASNKKRLPNKGV